MKKIIMGKADSKWRIADKVEYELKDFGIIELLKYHKVIAMWN